MKKLTIGRNNACDIIIPDTTDLVSRSQAVLTFSFFGKMVLYDTSNNGTYVNGQKVENGKGVRVTRKDKVNFARIADLDWNDVRDPYKKEKIISLSVILALVLASVVITLCLLLPAKENVKDLAAPKATEIEVEKGKTVTSVEPDTVVQEPKRSKRQSRKKVRNKPQKDETKGVTPRDVMNKEINGKAPIIY